MRHEHDNVTSLERKRTGTASPASVSPLNRGPHRPAAARVKLVQVKRTSHPEFPLERLCSHLYEPFQLTFARNAQQHFLTREDVEVVPSHRGLAIRAETEYPIDSAIVILKDLYGPNLRIGPPTIRYHKGALLEEPWMGMSIRCTPAHLDAVIADLASRDAIIDSCETEAGQCLIQARAPLATLLGYRSDLEKLTAGSGQHAMWLSHYEPVGSPPPGGAAA